MTRPLSDFRIENDQVVLLSFVDGGSYRVSPNDLHRYLEKSDIDKVHHALKLRQSFIRRVLPPTAMVFVVASIIGLGAYDMHRLTQMLSNPSEPTTKTTVPLQSVPQSQIQPKSSNSSTPAGEGAINSSSSNASSPVSVPAAKGRTQSAQGVDLGPVQTPVEPLQNSLKPLTNPVEQLVSPVVAPVIKKLPL